MPVCVAIDRLRPCTLAVLLAFQYTQTKSSSPLAADAQTQQGVIDERTSLDIPTVADPSRTAGEDVDEDKQDDEMSEPTHMTSAEKRKVDGTAKEFRASLPITASSRASSLRPDDENTRTAHTICKTSQNHKDGS